MLKCLGELGLEVLQTSLLKFLFEECVERHTLNRCLRSLVDYWIPTATNKKFRQELETDVAAKNHVSA